MFEQIPPRRVLEMHRGPGLPLGLPGCIWWGLSPPLGTASSTAAATAAATTGFTPGSGPGPSHGFTMARPARCPHRHWSLGQLLGEHADYHPQWYHWYRLGPNRTSLDFTLSYQIKLTYKMNIYPTCKWKYIFCNPFPVLHGDKKLWSPQTCYKSSATLKYV